MPTANRWSVVGGRQQVPPLKNQGKSRNLCCKSFIAPAVPLFPTGQPRSLCRLCSTTPVYGHVKSKSTPAS